MDIKQRYLAYFLRLRCNCYQGLGFCHRKMTHVEFSGMPTDMAYPSPTCPKHAAEDDGFPVMPIEEFLEKFKKLEVMKGETVRKAIAREIDPVLSECYCLSCRRKIYSDEAEDEDCYPPYCSDCEAKIYGHQAQTA